MNNTAEVYMWGTRIGIIHLGEGEKYASFVKCKRVIEEVDSAIKQWPAFAENAGVPEKTMNMIQSSFVFL